ncbi:SAM-dependent methyltransferase [Saccharopolyspora sp. NPDC000995]
MRLHALANRACLHRAIRMGLAAGVRQFPDVGCGIPTGIPAGRPRRGRPGGRADRSVAARARRPGLAAAHPARLFRCGAETVSNSTSTEQANEIRCLR